MSLSYADKKGDEIMSKFKIFTDSCSDLSKELRAEYGVDYFRMNIVVKGEEKHADLNFEEYSPEELYSWIADIKNHCKTTQVPGEEFESKMRPLLKEGYDILYIACSGKLTGSMNIFNLVRSELQEEFPDRRMIGIDSLNACLGEGMMTLDAARLQKQGKTLDEVVEWVESHKLKYNQCASVETLKYLKEAGRISGTSAFFGDIIGVKPIFISDAVGHNLVVEKVKGSKKALNRMFEMTRDAIIKEECDTVFVCQGMAQERAAELKKRLIDELGVKVVDAWIGPIIGVTCGPGVLATFCYGKEVTIVGEDAK